MAGGLAPALTARAGLRVLGAVFVLWAAATITFFAVRAVPGDPAETIIGGPGSQAGEEALAAARAEYGLDLPLWEQYLRYLGGLLSGDLGTSYALRAPVTEVIGEQLPGTLALALTALLLGWALALLLVRQAARGGRVSRVLGTIMEVTAAALPHFWLGAVLILVFATTLGWLPSVSTPDLPGLILPALTLAIPLAGFLGQLMRESADDALASTFALSARARGESPAGLFWRHVLRHAVLPAASLSGWAFGTLISGAVIVETLFARPGLGRTLFLAVQGRDVPVVTGTVLVVALAYVLITFAGDLLEMLVDPRRRRV